MSSAHRHHPIQTGLSQGICAHLALFATATETLTHQGTAGSNNHGCRLSALLVILAHHVSINIWAMHTAAVDNPQTCAVSKWNLRGCPRKTQYPGLRRSGPLCDQTSAGAHQSGDILL